MTREQIKVMQQLIQWGGASGQRQRPINLSHLRVLDVVARTPGVSAREIARELGWGIDSTDARVRVLARGTAQRTGIGLLKSRLTKNGQSYATRRYRLTKRGARVYVALGGARHD